jgi:hypothetical protein
MDWRWQSDEEQHELIIDFAREAHVWGHLNYYVYVKNVNSDNLVRLYIEFEEEKTEVYLFDDISSKYIREQYINVNEDEIIKLDMQMIYNFKLVRIIPPHGHVPIDSYFRIKLKSKAENKGFISVEDEVHINTRNKKYGF